MSNISTNKATLVQDPKTGKVYNLAPIFEFLTAYDIDNSFQSSASEIKIGMGLIMQRLIHPTIFDPIAIGKNCQNGFNIMAALDEITRLENALSQIVEL